MKWFSSWLQKTFHRLQHIGERKLSVGAYVQPSAQFGIGLYGSARQRHPGWHAACRETTNSMGWGSPNLNDETIKHNYRVSRHAVSNRLVRVREVQLISAVAKISQVVHATDSPNARSVRNWSRMDITDYSHVCTHRHVQYSVERGFMGYWFNNHLVHALIEIERHVSTIEGDYRIYVIMQINCFTAL